MAFPRGRGYRRAEVDAYVAAQERAIASLQAEVERLRAADPLAGASSEVTELIGTFARVVAELRSSAEREAVAVRRAAQEDAALVRDEAAQLLERERARATLLAEDILRRAHHEIELLTRTQDRVDEALNDAARGIVSMIDLFDHLRLPGAPREPAPRPPEEIDLRDPPRDVAGPREVTEDRSGPVGGEHAGSPEAAPHETGPAGAEQAGGPMAFAPGWPAPDPAARVAVSDAGFGPSAPGPALRRMPPDGSRIPRPAEAPAPNVRRLAPDIRPQDDADGPLGAVPFDPRNGRVVDFDPPADETPS